MRFFEAINELAVSTGIGQLQPDETGSVTLLFDSKHEITFMPDADGEAVFFQCEVGDASMLGYEGYKTLLEASFSQTDGAAFSIHPAFQKVVLWKRYGEFTSLNAFEKTINDFLGQVVVWKQHLQSGDFRMEEIDDSLPPNMPSFTSNFIQV